LIAIKFAAFRTCFVFIFFLGAVDLIATIAFDFGTVFTKAMLIQIDVCAT
jgi:hypothetical protein